jgi:hypothetical protein
MIGPAFFEKMTVVKVSRAILRAPVQTVSPPPTTRSYLEDIFFSLKILEVDAHLFVEVGTSRRTVETTKSTII